MQANSRSPCVEEDEDFSLYTSIYDIYNILHFFPNKTKEFNPRLNIKQTKLLY